MVWTANPKPNFSYKISVLIPASQERKKKLAGGQKACVMNPA